MGMSPHGSHNSVNPQIPFSMQTLLHKELTGTCRDDCFLLARWNFLNCFYVILVQEEFLSLDTSIQEFHCFGLIAVDRSLGGRTVELLITPVQPSKEQSEAVLCVSYHIRTYWRTAHTWRMFFTCKHGHHWNNCSLTLIL